jgi:hypothetical protein
VAGMEERMHEPVNLTGTQDESRQEK